MTFVVSPDEMASRGRVARLEQLLIDAVGVALAESGGALTYAEVLVAMNSRMSRYLGHLMASDNPEGT